MTQQELQKIFESEFNWDNWKKVMNFVFPEFKFNLTQTDLAKDTKAKEEKAGYIKVHGQSELASNEILMLCEVLVKDKIRLDRNIKSVRSLVAGEVIPNFQTVIAVFHNADNTKWRFTLVVKEFSDDLETYDKKPDSYTYVFGVGEKGRTAAERFTKLAEKPSKTLKDLEEAFSVEALSKKFFKEYKGIYQQFVDDIKDNPSKLALFPDTSREKQEKNARDFVKKMMGRIIFLYFLQKKGWLGCKTKWKGGDELFMQTFVDKAKRDDNFYFQYLEPLFFDTLNEKRAKHDEDCIIQKTNFGKVPYLNGGLFEKDENHPEALTVKWDIFAELFETLNSYNFTIIEDDPEFKEVAVDPEMLGHIFENLLEDNKDKGAFYTPKEIVHYMCQESLLEYLKTYLQQNQHWPTSESDSQQLESALQRFVKQKLAGGVIDYDKPLAKALKDVKICDPAIGSGAFPMGLLDEIYNCVHKLHDESPDSVGKIWNIGKNWQGNQVKMNIIQNSIYGVDIEKGAVDIARLRFWLSLIIDEDQPKPLPNLDFKIVVGDSLLPMFENDVLIIDWGLKSSTVESERPDLIKDHAKLNEQLQKTQLTNLNNVVQRQKEYFTTDESKKEKIFREIQMLKLEVLRGQVKQELLKIGKQKEAFGQTGIFSSQQTTKQIAIQEGELKFKQLEKHISKKIANKDCEFKHFDWKLDFPEILNDALVDIPGFDIVIGNPPYVQLQKIVEYSDALEKSDFRTYTRGGDLYCVFYEEAIKILKNHGVVSLITSNSWMKTKYGESLRDYLVEYANPLKLLNFEDTKVFPTATVEVNILLCKKEEFKRNLAAVVLRPDYQQNTSLDNYFTKNAILIEELSLEGWIILSKQDYELKKHIDAIGIPLRNFNVSINFGIKTGFNKAFLVPGDIKDQLIKRDGNNSGILKPILRGRDLTKYSIKFDDLWLINSHNGIKSKGIPPINIKQDYPIVYEYLNPFRKELEKRSDKGEHWTNLRNCAYLEEFEKPKILWGELSDKPKFSYDDGRYYAEATLFLMTGSNLKFLLAILNSRLASWYFNQITTTSGMGTNRWKKYKIEQLPIAKSDTDKRKFEVLTDYLIYLNDPQSQQANPYVENVKIASIFEDVLNMMVYELYFTDHMKQEGLQVLDFVDIQNIFRDITQLKNDSEKGEVINMAYGHLQETDNIIRNRVINSNLKSENIIRRINSTTH